MYLLPPKTPLITIIALLAIFGFLIYPVWNFWWIEKRLWRRLSALVLLAILVCGFGYYVWPINQQIQESKQLTSVVEKSPQASDIKDSQKEQPKQSTAQEKKKFNILENKPKIPAPQESRFPFVDIELDHGDGYAYDIYVHNESNATLSKIIISRIINPEKNKQKKPSGDPG